jgi:hypothetical protein
MRMTDYILFFRTITIQIECNKISELMMTKILLNSSHNYLIQIYTGEVVKCRKNFRCGQTSTNKNVDDWEK